MKLIQCLGKNVFSEYFYYGKKIASLGDYMNPSLLQKFKASASALLAAGSLSACADGNPGRFLTLEVNPQGLSVACTRGGAEVLYVDGQKDIKVEGQLYLSRGGVVDGRYRGGVGAAYAEGYSRNGFPLQLNRLAMRYPSGTINAGDIARTLNGIDAAAQLDFLNQYRTNGACRRAVEPWMANGYVPRPLIPNN